MLNRTVRSNRYEFTIQPFAPCPLLVMLPNPILTVEVAPPSTVDEDRTAELRACTIMESVHPYWLFEPDRAFVTLYERCDESSSIRTLTGLDAAIESSLFEAPFSLSDLYVPPGDEL